jgi:integral membrane protein (TIGR01906 family)
MRLVEKVNAIALGIIVWIVLVLSVLQFTAFNVDFYREQYAYRDTAAIIGVSETDLIKVTEVLLDYTSGKRADMIVDVEVNGVMKQYYNQREIDHMVDVRVLYLKVLQIRDVLLMFGLVNIFALFAFRKKKVVEELNFGLIWVSVGFGTMILLLGSFAIINFDAFWTAFHKVFFTNDLWLLDPYTDNLINMVPQEFFIDLIVMILIHFSLSLMSIFVLLKAEKAKGITQNSLKVIAVITMTIDHMGYFLFPEIREMRIIGRIAYPIFTYLFAMSYRFSHDKIKLLVRLVIFAIAGHLLISWAGDSGFYNILFLFILGWIAFWVIDQKKGLFVNLIVVALLAFLAQSIGVDYGYYGILTLVIFYVFYDHRWKQFLFFSILTILFSFEWLITNLLTNDQYWTYLPTIFSRGIYTYTSYFPQVFAILALIPIGFYVYKAPKSKTSWTYIANQYFFYFYYPIHFAILAYLHFHP